MSLRDYINSNNNGFQFPRLATNDLSFYRNIDITGSGCSITHTPTTLNINPIPNGTNATKLEYNPITHNVSYSPTVFGDFINTFSIPIPANTPTPIGYSSSEIELNCKIDGAVPSRLVVNVNGVYKVGTSIQFLKGGGGEVEVDIWFRKNGNDIPHSASAVILTGGAGSRQFSYVEIIDQLNAGDFIEIVVGTTDATISVEAFAEQVAPPFARPSIPSIITTIYKLN